VAFFCRPRASLARLPRPRLTRCGPRQGWGIAKSAAVPTAHACGVFLCSVIWEIPPAALQGTRGALASPSVPIFFCFALHCGRVRILHLQPIPRPPRPIGRTKPLAHDPLEAELTGVAENNIRWQIVAMVVELNARSRLNPQHRRQCAFARRMSSPLSSIRSKANRNTRPSWHRYLSRSNTGSPLPSQATASPSIRNDRARRASAACAISGNRPVQSCPLRVRRRTPAGSRRTIMRKPSSFISWIQPGPGGGRSAGEGRQGSINADTRVAGFLLGHRPTSSSRGNLYSSCRPSQSAQNCSHAGRPNHRQSIARWSRACRSFHGRPRRMRESQRQDG